jgi:hypothetical protein
MAVNSAAFPAKAGYNQSGGGYYYIIDTGLWAKLNVPNASSGSGGAYAVSAFSAISASVGTPAGGAGVSTLFGAGRILRDMGKTVVSAGRAFRKVQGVVPADVTATVSTFGIAGAAAGTLTSADAGYLTYYVEVATPATAVPLAADLPQIVRM